MEWKKLPLVLLMALGLLFLAIGCDSDDEEEPPPPAGHLTLEAASLDFSTTITEQQITLSNTGDADLTWNISDPSVPYWTDVDPTSGNLVADAQTQITIRVERTGVSPGTTTATLMFLSDENDDTLLVSVERNCNILSDDFNEGGAADWDATDMNVSQSNDGYVVLDPNDIETAGRLLQAASPAMPYTVSARIRRTNQTADIKQYGLFFEDIVNHDVLYFTVFTDADTNYTLEQYENNGEWEVLRAGFTDLLSTEGEVWNILRLEIYDDGGTIKARGYAGTEDLPLFDDVTIDQDLTFTKMGLRSEEYTIHADWFCAQ